MLMHNKVLPLVYHNRWLEISWQTVKEFIDQAMELYGRRRIWTTGLAQQSNMYGVVPCNCCLFCLDFVINSIAYHLVRYRHNLLLLKSSMMRPLFCCCCCCCILFKPASNDRGFKSQQVPDDRLTFRYLRNEKGWNGGLGCAWAY